MTPCGHYFHGGCLKKWLFVQDHCPMCSSKIIEEQGLQDIPDMDRDVQEDPVEVNDEDVEVLPNQQ